MSYGTRGYRGGGLRRRGGTVGLRGARFRGDPFLGGLLKTVGKVVGAVVPGPIGTVARVLTGAGSRRRRRQTARGLRPAQLPVPQMGIPSPFTGARAPAAAAAEPTADGCPKGYRLNKSDYFLKDGTFVPAQTRCVRIRRRNPANIRALRSALGREESFIRIARRSGLVALPKARRVRRAARKRR